MRGLIYLTVFFLFLLLAFGLPGLGIGIIAVGVLSIAPPLMVALRRHNSVEYPPRISRFEESLLQISLHINRLFYANNTFLVGVPLVHLSLAAGNKHLPAIAEQRMQEALSLADSVNSAKKVGFTEVNNALVLAAELTKVGRFKECKQLIEKTLRVSEKLTDPKAVRIHLQLLLVCAFACWSLGDQDDCESYSREALDLGGERHDQEFAEERFHSYNFLMLLALEKADLENASRLVERSKNFAQEVKTNRKEVFLLIADTNLAVVHCLKGDYGKGERLLRSIYEQSSLGVSSKERNAEKARVCQRSAVLLTVLYADCGLVEEADAFASFVRTQLDAPGELMMKVILANDLAHAMHLLGRESEAEQYAQMAIEILKDYIPADHYLRATLANNLSEVNLALGRLEMARQHLERAKEIRSAQFNENHPYNLRSHHTEAELLLAEGKYEESLKEAEYSLTKRKKVYGLVNLETLKSFEVYARVLEKLGRMDEARQAAGSVNEIRSSIVSQLSKNKKSIGSSVLLEGKVEE